MNKSRLIVCIAFALMVVFHGAMSQQIRRSQPNVAKTQQTILDNKSPEMKMDDLVIDGPLDPDHYIVGVGDVLQISIEMNPPISGQVPVTAEGLVVMPIVGEISVKGLSLTEARKVMKEHVHRAIKTSELSVGLVLPRRIRVRLVGSAVVPGVFEAWSSDRVSTLLDNPELRRAVKSVEVQRRASEVNSVPLASRSILLRRLDGTEYHIDLLQYRITGDGSWNPHLVEGDEIIADAFDERIPSIAIGGAVWLPARFEYKAGDTFGSILRFARGLKSSAKSDSVILYRHAEPPAVLSHADSLYPLQAGDRVWVPSNVDVFRADIVSVTGEVSYPGIFPIEYGVTRLSDVLTMAGGMTNHALIHGATVQRPFSGLHTRDLDFAAAFRGNASLEDTMYVRQEFEIRAVGEIVPADFGRAILEPGGAHDPLVYGGDMIHVPKRTGTVYVFGQVARPGHYPYVEGMNPTEYIRAAGGYTSRARESDMVVIKMDTRQWVDPEKTVVLEGDAIWGPREVQMGLWYELSSYAQIGSIASSLATVVIVLAQLLR